MLAKPHLLSTRQPGCYFHISSVNYLRGSGWRCLKHQMCNDVSWVRSKGQRTKGSQRERDRGDTRSQSYGQRMKKGPSTAAAPRAVGSWGSWFWGPAWLSLPFQEELSGPPLVIRILWSQTDLGLLSLHLYPLAPCLGQVTALSEPQFSH